VVLDPGELDRQTELKQILDSRYHVVHSDGYLVFDLSRPAGI
jgi:hypothetical protein